MDPVELRRKNHLRIGDTTATGQIIKENVDLSGLMDRALAEIGYSEKRKAYALHNAADTDAQARAWPSALFMHGCGFTGIGETYMASVAGVEGLPDGTVRALTAATEMGQGKSTVFAQIVAEALRLPLDMVDATLADTKYVPNSGPTVASRSTMVVGKLVEDAAYGLKQALIQQGFLKASYTPEEFREAHAQGRRPARRLQGLQPVPQAPPHPVGRCDLRGRRLPHLLLGLLRGRRRRGHWSPTR